MMRPIDEQLAALEDLSSTELRDDWRRLTGTASPRISPSMLRLAFAWEIQARAQGGLSRATQQKLAQLAEGRTRTTLARAGMRLVREWGGTAHVVTIDEDKVIRWNGKAWNSLSEVARAITGTRWPGPAFFGLKTRAKAA
jgi:hypothetical protein